MFGTRPSLPAPFSRKKKQKMSVFRKCQGVHLEKNTDARPKAAATQDIRPGILLKQEQEKAA